MFCMVLVGCFRNDIASLPSQKQLLPSSSILVSLWPLLLFNFGFVIIFVAFFARRFMASSQASHYPKNVWIQSRIFLYVVLFVCLYMEVICPITVKYGILFRRILRSVTWYLYIRNIIIFLFVSNLFAGVL